MAAPEVTDYLRYLQLRRAELAGRPALHRHGLAAHDRLLGACQQASSAAELAAAISAAGPLSLLRAEWLDRYSALERLHRALGDPRKARAAALQVDAARAAGDRAEDLLERIRAVHGPAATLRQRADDSAGALRQLISELVWLIGEGDAGERAERRRRVAVLWQALREADPALTWSGLRGSAFYRLRLPFGDGALDWLGAQLAGIVGDLEPPTRAAEEPPIPAIAPPAPAAVSSRVPSAVETAAGYRAAHDALDPDDAAQRSLYGRILELADTARDGHELLRWMAEDDLFTRLARARLLAGVERDWATVRGLGQPHAERHYAELADRLGGCRSPLEIELEGIARSETLAIDGAWFEAFSNVALRPVAAALTWERAPSAGTAEALARSCEAVRHLLGRPWDRVLAAAPIQSLGAVLVELGQRAATATPRAGPVAGAALPDLAPALRRAMIHATEREAEALAARDPEAIPAFLESAIGRPRFATFAALMAAVRALVDGALGGRGTAAMADPPATVCYRGRELSLERVPAALGASWPDPLAEPVVESADG